MGSTPGLVHRVASMEMGGRKLKGEEQRHGSGYRNLVGIDLDKEDDTDIGESRKPAVKSWVQRKRDSFEMMSASRNDNFGKNGVNIKFEENRRRQQEKKRAEEEVVKIGISKCETSLCMIVSKDDELEKMLNYPDLK